MLTAIGEIESFIVTTMLFMVTYSWTNLFKVFLDPGVVVDRSTPVQKNHHKAHQPGGTTEKEPFETEEKLTHKYRDVILIAITVSIMAFGYLWYTVEHINSNNITSMHQLNTTLHQLVSDN